MTSDEHLDYVLDAFALLAYLQDEPSAPYVARFFESAEADEATIWMSVVNFAEAIYIIERQNGLDKTLETLATIDKLPFHLVDVHRTSTLGAAHIKANHALSLADAFAGALAKEKNARLITGDPEFGTLAGEISIQWLRRK